MYGPNNGTIHVGDKSSDFQYWERTQLCFHDFEDQPTDGTGTQIYAGFSCLGHEWNLTLFPGGDDREHKTALQKGMVSAHLGHLTAGCIFYEYGIAVKDGNDNKIVDFTTSTMAAYADCEYHTNFISRQKALNSLFRGALVFEIRMRRTEYPSVPYIPKNPSACRTVQELFKDEESADIAFEVSENRTESKENGSKKRKSELATTTTFRAHSLILKKAAPLLAEMCTTDGDLPATIPILYASSKIFHTMLQYIYGYEIDFGTDESHTKKIIEAADMYGVTNLKLEAEARYVSSIRITLENVMEHLHFAVSKNCALLKDAVMSFVVENEVAIVDGNVLADAPANLMNDVLSAMMRRFKKDDREILFNYNFMSVSELRRRADRLGIEIDGSKETLVASLKAVEETVYGNVDH
jgi:hypothetical protein